MTLEDQLIEMRDVTALVAWLQDPARVNLALDLARTHRDAVIARRQLLAVTGPSVRCRSAQN